MKPRIPLSLLALSVAIATGLAAENEAEASRGDNSSRPRTSTISPRLSAAIRAKLPEYEPAPDAGKTESGGDDADVVVMNPIFVRERKPPPASQWQFLTESGRAAVLKERHKGATVPGAPLTESVHNYAMQMNRDEMRLERLAELDDAEAIYRATGYPDDWKNLKKEVLKARMRPKDMRAESMDRSYNNDRR
jgi:hypothetical protein